MRLIKVLLTLSEREALRKRLLEFSPHLNNPRSIRDKKEN